MGFVRRTITNVVFLDFLVILGILQLIANFVPEP